MKFPWSKSGKEKPPAEPNKSGKGRGQIERTGVFRRLAGEPDASTADREELISILAEHIGPLARPLVERIDSRGLTRNDLFMEAAQALEDDLVRERFMKQMGLYR